jgi:hypothetical protein
VPSFKVSHVPPSWPNTQYQPLPCHSAAPLALPDDDALDDADALPDDQLLPQGHVGQRIGWPPASTMTTSGEFGPALYVHGVDGIRHAPLADPHWLASIQRTTPATDIRMYELVTSGTFGMFGTTSQTSVGTVAMVATTGRAR